MQSLTRMVFGMTTTTATPTTSTPTTEELQEAYDLRLSLEMGL